MSASAFFFPQVYLDISFSFDPEVILPVIILPPDLAPGSQPGVPAGPYPAGGFGGPSNSDFPPPGASMGPYPAVGTGGPSNSNFPPPGALMAPYPAGGFGGPINSDFPAPAVPMGLYPTSPYTGNYGSSGAQSYSAPPPVYPDNPPPYASLSGVYPALPAHVSGSYNNPAPQLASPYGSSSSSSVLHLLPSAPTFHPPISASGIHPSPASPPSNVPPTAPTYSLLPSAPMMNTDFLSQSDDAPPAYSPSFLTSDTRKTDTKE